MAGFLLDWGPEAHAVTFAGGNFGDWLFGGLNPDTLIGHGGADRLAGKGGHDLLDGGRGNDLIIGGPGPDHAFGGEDNDVFLIEAASDLTGDTIDGGLGADRVRFAPQTGAQTLLISADMLNIEIVEITDPNGLLTATTPLHINAAAARNGLILIGNHGGNAIEGSAFADDMSGNDGSDSMVGNAGGDFFRGGLGQDVIDGGAGMDSVSFSEKTASVVVALSGAIATTVRIGGANEDSLANVENVFGGRAGDTLIGDSLANALSGSDGNDTLDGMGGIDILNGGLGNDTYRLGNGGDVVQDAGGIDLATSTITRSLIGSGLTVIENLVLEGAGNVAGTGNNLANVISGNAAANVLRGGLGNDVLRGFAGNDQLYGEAGRDALTGGLNSDLFRFTSAAHSPVGAGADVITDLDDFGKDRIDLSAVYGGTLAYRHNLAFTATGQVRINDIAGGDLLVEVNTGGSLAADMQIRLSSTTLASMAANDFIL